jgi:hypothetical protein
MSFVSPPAPAHLKADKSGGERKRKKWRVFCPAPAARRSPETVQPPSMRPISALGCDSYGCSDASLVGDLTLAGPAVRLAGADFGQRKGNFSRTGRDIRPSTVRAPPEHRRSPVRARPSAAETVQPPSMRPISALGCDSYGCSDASLMGDLTLAGPAVPLAGADFAQRKGNSSRTGRDIRPSTVRAPPEHRRSPVRARPSAAETVQPPSMRPISALGCDSYGCSDASLEGDLTLAGPAVRLAGADFGQRKGNSSRTGRDIRPSTARAPPEHRRSPVRARPSAAETVQPPSMRPISALGCDSYGCSDASLEGDLTLAGPAVTVAGADFPQRMGNPRANVERFGRIEAVRLGPVGPRRMRRAGPSATARRGEGDLRATDLAATERFARTDWPATDLVATERFARHRTTWPHRLAGHRLGRHRTICPPPNDLAAPTGRPPTWPPPNDLPATERLGRHRTICPPPNDLAATERFARNRLDRTDWRARDRCGSAPIQSPQSIRSCGALTELRLRGGVSARYPARNRARLKMVSCVWSVRWYIPCSA